MLGLVWVSTELTPSWVMARLKVAVAVELLRLAESMAPVIVGVLAVVVVVTGPLERQREAAHLAGLATDQTAAPERSIKQVAVAVARGQWGVMQERVPAPA